MNIEKSYMMLLEFLDYYYFNINFEENKQGMLGGMLGAMTPQEIFGGDIPDKTFYIDWTVIVKEKFPLSQDYKICFLSYFDYYIEKFDFDFLVPIKQYICSDDGSKIFYEIQKRLLNEM